MYILASGMWFSKLIRQFFYSIDKIVYNFIPAIYDLLISITRTSVLTQGDIASMADRIYKLLAVFMVFKVTFSLIMYVVNPDDFSDKNKGVGKLGTNIVISLALLILTPYVFRYAYQLQTIVLEDNSLGTLIFGSESDENFLNTAGDNMAYITLSPFFTPNVSLIELYECTELVEKDSNGNVHFNESCSGIDSVDYEDLDDDSSMHSLIDDTFDVTDLKNYVAGVEANSMPLMFRQDMATATTTKSSSTSGTKEQEFIMDYKWGFSTVVGIIIVLLLVSFCMDVALRSIKLAFLQLIAPIPIISYVDPKSGKDGMFKKWVDMCVKTFLSLFIRLLALYFAVYIIGKVADLKMVDIIDGSYVSNGFIAIFIIVGALMFAKNFTKILEGLGIKLDSGFTLNPLRKLEKEALGGGVLKKPNDMLAKAGKGIVKSPFSGMALLGKKTIGGIDAARNGKGFKQGWDRTHGKLYNNFYKKLDEWAPDSAEQRKNERLGREEVKQMNTKWNKGKQKADALYAYARENNIPVDKPFDLLNGKTEEPYRQVYKNEEFIRSRMNLDKKDEERKILQRVSDMTARGISVKDAIKAESVAINNVGGDFAKKLLDQQAGLVSLSEAEAAARLTKSLDDTTKAVSGMEKVHESIRKQNPVDAATEDQLKFVKYNNIDPTEPTKAAASESWASTKVTVTESTSNTKQPEIIFGTDSTTAEKSRVFDGRKQQIEEEISESIEEINGLLSKSEQIDEDVNQRLKNLKEELEKMIREKENARDQQDRDEIDKDINKIKEEINKLLSNE